MVVGDDDDVVPLVDCNNIDGGGCWKVGDDIVCAMVVVCYSGAARATGVVAVVIRTVRETRTAVTDLFVLDWIIHTIVGRQRF